MLSWYIAIISYRVGGPNLMDCQLPQTTDPFGEQRSERLAGKTVAGFNQLWSRFTHRAMPPRCSTRGEIEAHGYSRASFTP